MVSADTHRPSLRDSPQAVKPKPGDVQILGLSRDFQQLHDAHTLPDIVRADPACFTGAVDLFKPFVPEALDHPF